MLPASGPERVSAQGGTDPSVVGSWSAPFDVGVKAIHGGVLPNGQVLLFSYPFHAVGSDAYVWIRPRRLYERESHLEPGHLLRWALAAARRTAVDHRRPCAPRRLRARGQEPDIYDPATASFSSGPLLGEERWYPTNVALGSGRVLIFGGFKDVDASQKAMTVDSYDPVSTRSQRCRPQPTRVTGTTRGSTSSPTGRSLGPISPERSSSIPAPTPGPRRRSRTSAAAATRAPRSFSPARTRC